MPNTVPALTPARDRHRHLTLRRCEPNVGFGCALRVLTRASATFKVATLASVVERRGAHLLDAPHATDAIDATAFPIAAITLRPQVSAMAADGTLADDTHG